MENLGPLGVLKTIQVLLIMSAMSLLPGWAMLAVTGYWRRWEGLQRWFLAVCLGLAFWPPLFYFSRLVLPSMRIGFNKLVVLLVLLLVTIIWKLRKNWHEQFALGKHWWIVIVILIVAFYFRFALIELLPFPSWTDSLHHTILTELTSATGKLPYDLMPYDSATLQEYHLGLYALTAPLKILSGLPAPTALLWMCQFLNALCGLGVFLILDKKVSRSAGIFGMMTVCFFSFQPANYFFWGRFTQLGAQTLLLAGAAMFWDTLSLWKKTEKQRGMVFWAAPALTALVFASLALIHFRVAGYTFPLVLLIFFAAIFAEPHEKRANKQVILVTVCVAALALLLVSPAFIPAIRGYLSPNSPIQVQVLENMSNTYHGGNTLETFFAIGLAKWLSVIALVGGAVGLVLKKARTLTLVTVLWVLGLMVMGNLYRTGIRTLAFTNMTAIFIMAYLPAGIMVGILAHLIESGAEKIFKSHADKALIVFSLLGLVFGIRESILLDQDMVRRENFRYLLRESDLQAMQWASKNTPQDSMFAINTHAWLPDAAHGSDGGYWLPYFAGRATTSGTMISNYRDDYESVLEREKWVLKLYDPATMKTAMTHLCDLGVDYLYSGEKDPFTAMDFDFTALDQLPSTELIYDENGVQIMQICTP